MGFLPLLLIEFYSMDNKNIDIKPYVKLRNDNQLDQNNTVLKRQSELIEWNQMTLK